MASFVDLEDEDLINADENDLYEGRNAFIDAVEQAVDSPGNQDNPASPDGPDASEPATTKIPLKKKVVRNPQPKLDAERLKGPRGLIILESWFNGMKFRGKGNEKEDLDSVMCRLEQWTHRLFPKLTFDDCLSRIEKLGHKKPVMNYVRRIRLDMEENYSATATHENDDVIEEEPVIDTFDSLLNDSIKNFTQDKTVQPPPHITLTQEQRERMIRNRLLAEERRLARVKAKAEEELARLQMVANKSPKDWQLEGIETEPEQSNTATENEPRIASVNTLIDSSQKSSSQSNFLSDPSPMTLTQEQRERIIHNRLLAEERRLAHARARAEELASQRSEANAYLSTLGESTRNEVEIDESHGVREKLDMDVEGMTAINNAPSDQRQGESTIHEMPT